MKADLDRLMDEQQLDALIIEGPDGLGSANSEYNYFVRGQKLTGFVIKKRGEPAILIHSTWEQQQAEATGLQLISKDRWNIRDILQQVKDPLLAAAEYRRQIYSDLGVQGRVGLYGTVQASSHHALIGAISQLMPDIQFVAQFERNVISLARLTKEPEEVELMRDVGRRTCAVVQAVVDFIGSCDQQGEVVVDPQGQPVVIGDIHRLIRRECAALDLEMPHGVIFAQGADAGQPHHHGTESAPLMVGKAIVFDIYPRQAGGGYYHDMTRTFAIGHASAELQTLYDQVLGAFEHVMGELESGAPTKVFQDMTCAYFEQRGHPTIGSTYPIEAGYIHSLGHGLGLEVHEDFSFSSMRDRGDVIQPGAVFSIEPGLYYPGREIGIRIEDTVYCRPDGSFESLTPFPKQLVIPLRQTSQV